ncbi:MAG: hypothetical protein B6I38_03020 [Anaerolineaceae bacterium 4572_5.1]|nr:MAG: hypothetical protein B6I38_03020 [Anaerolineaceae bacterium 4572_5.1]
MKTTKLTIVILLIASLIIAAAPRPAPRMQDGNPPDHPVKLIFIHHSTGENWLADGYGDLGRTLGENNYFVSDTNYGWGPNGIGDRTDIPNWVEWFASDETPTYMNALFNESEQNSSYTRNLSDPGGENVIIMFKSCFPNSDLYGNPNDPPGDYEDMTVSGAKYVYNTILQYFATRPDKLFIAITAPPLSDPSNAANARAFNNWLVNDWLADYEGSNVAVFDFYDVLTGPNGGNTLYYPSGDDHPSAEGSRIATAEFLPQLNDAYNRWQAGDASAPPADEEPTPAAEAPPVPELYPAQSAALIDNFETDNPPGTNGWEPFWDESTPTSMHCTAEAGTVHSGERALILDFDVSPDAWATCALFYDNPQNWSSSEGLSFYVHAAESALILDVDLYVEGADGEDESYVYMVETTPESVDGWMRVDLAWDQFHRVDWEANAGTPFAKQDQISGMAFGFSTYPDTPNIGTIWVDDLQLMGTQSAVQPESPASDSESEETPADESRGRRRLPCLGSLILPLGLAGVAFRRKKKKYHLNNSG